MNKRVPYFAGNNFLRILLSILLLFTSETILSQKKRSINFSDFIDGQRILFLGDSITQDGRYVSFIEYYLNSNFKERSVDLISIGLSSETVSGLTEPGHPYKRPCLFDRLDFALSQIKPQTVVACYGMNDGIYHPQSEDRMKAYQDGINKLIDKVKAINAKLVIITPPMFDTVSAKFKPVGDDSKEFGYSKPYHRYDEVLGDYAIWLMSLKVQDVRVLDLHAAMNEYVLKQRKLNPDFSFSKDGIHPQEEGHLFMAQQFMKEIGVDITTNSLSSELKRLEADSLFMLIKQHREIRSKGWLEYIGYTLEKRIKIDIIDDIEVKENEFQKKIGELNYRKKKNSIYFEALGNGFKGSINYERHFLMNWSVRIGFALPTQSHDLYGDSFSRITFPIVMINHLIPLRNPNKNIEIGLGVIYLPKDSESQKRMFLPSFSIGYIYIPIEGGNVFKVAFTPMFPLFMPWVGIAIGYQF